MNFRQKQSGSWSGIIGKSIFWQLLTTFLLSAVCIGVLQFFITLFLSKQLATKVEQQLYWDVASELSQRLPTGSLGEIENLKSEFDLKRVNPELELFLIDSQGKIAFPVKAEEKLARKQISTQPLEESLSDRSPQLPLRAEDPKDATAETTFSSSRITIAGESYYVFLAIRSKVLEYLENFHGKLFILKSLSRGFYITILLEILLFFCTVSYLTKSFRKLLRALRKIERQDFQIDVKIETNDEVGNLSRAINKMAESIATQLSFLEQLVRRRKNMILNLIHDVRGPIASVKGFLETLLYNNSLSEETRKSHLSIIARSIRNQQDLLSGLFALSSFEAQETVPQKNPCSMLEIASETFNEIKFLADRKVIETKFIAPESLPEIFADKLMLKRVINNLFANAIHYTPEGGKIQLTLESVGDKIKFSIMDSGIGIAKDEIPLIFKDFYRADQGQIENTTGTGLGLAIVKKILDLHQSEIKVESELNKGTTFSFELLNLLSAPCNQTISVSNNGSSPQIAARINKPDSISRFSLVNYINNLDEAKKSILTGTISGVGILFFVPTTPSISSGLLSALFGAVFGIGYWRWYWPPRYSIRLCFPAALCLITKLYISTRYELLLLSYYLGIGLGLILAAGFERKKPRTLPAKISATFIVILLIISSLQTYFANRSWIEAIQETDRLTLSESVEKIARRLGLEIEEDLNNFRTVPSSEDLIRHELTSLNPKFPFNNEAYRILLRKTGDPYTALFLVWSWLGTITIAGIIAYTLYKTMTSSLKTITWAVKKFEEGDYGVRVPNIDCYELNPIVSALNSMAASIEANTLNLNHEDSLRREFIQKITTDLKDPLASMTNRMELLSSQNSKTVDIETRNNILYVYGQTLRQSLLLDSLFELTKLQSKQQKPELTDFVLGELLDDTLMGIADLMNLREISAEVSPSTFGVSVWADISMIEKLLKFLLEQVVLSYNQCSTIYFKINAHQTLVELEIKIISTNQEPKNKQTEPLPHLDFKDKIEFELRYIEYVLSLHESHLFSDISNGDACFKFSLRRFE